jgi:hypothetical protein
MEEMTADELQATAHRMMMEAASALERAVARMAEQQVALAAEAESQVGRIVATVETQREAELERKLAAAEAKIAQLMASAAEQPTGRKTLPTSMATMLAKQGVVMDSVEAGAIDGALASLSIEQRIAVKSELMRAGVLNPSDRG